MGLAHLFSCYISVFVGLVFVATVPSSAAEPELQKRLTPAELGKHIFLDSSLSSPKGQACVSCHQPQYAFADPRAVSIGADGKQAGHRNAPSLMYAALIPGFAYEDALIDGQEVYFYEGGLFHDGRAKDLFEQVQKPFFSKQEMNLSGESELADRLRSAKYADEFRRVVGESVWNDDEALAYHVYRALVEFLKEPLFRPFNAKIDAYLAGNERALNAAELRGLKVYRDQGKCADCHFLEPTTWEKTLLSDFGYDNLGVPSRGKRDSGLGGHTGESEEVGKFRAPSLRNVALTAPYMHNGSLKTLQEVVEFYNRRDIEPKRWGKTDYPNTVNKEDLGDLKLTDQQVRDLVAFMKTFTDRTLIELEPGEFPMAPSSAPSSIEKKLYFPDWTHRLHKAYPGKFDK